MNRTKVTYTNIPPYQSGGGGGASTGDLKVCKTSATPSFQGRLFSFAFNAGAAFSIEAGTPTSPVCSQPTSYPIGTRVLVQELSMPNVIVSSITVSDGRGTGIDLANSEATAIIGAGTTIVTYDNEPAPLQQNGYVEICKDAAGPDVTGLFSFKITTNTTTQTASAYAGQCTGPIEVPAGNVTLEEVQQNGIQLTSVSTLPADRLFSANLINRTATVEVPVGGVSTETQVHFLNAAIMGQLKVCKALAAGSDALDGQTFSFDVTRHADADSPGPTQRVSVRAFVASTQCVIVGSFPVGEQVRVSEVSPGSYVDVSGEGVVTIASGINSITITNTAKGILELCKAAVAGLTTQPSFRFRVDGGAIILVRAGACTLPMRVAIGQHSVQELAENDYELNPNAPGGGLDVLPADRLVTRNTGLRTITVNVPYGETGETLVNVTNRVKLGSVKVCKAVPTSSLDALGSKSFDFTVLVDGVAKPGATGLTAGTCSLPIGPFPILRADGTPTIVKVTEDGTSATASWVLGGVGCIGCRSPSSNVTAPDGTLLGMTFALGTDINALTFTNTAPPAP
jgi:hypothetical protein